MYRVVGSKVRYFKEEVVVETIANLTNLEMHLVIAIWKNILS